MKILITTEKAKFIDNIDCVFGYGTTKEIITDKNIEIYLYNLKMYYPFLIKKEIMKIKKSFEKEDMVYFTDEVPEYIKNEFTKYTYNYGNIFLTHFSGIIQKFKASIDKNALDIGIISIKSDKAIFQIIDKLKDHSKTISIVTEDDSFFEEISDYGWTKYGMLVNLKEFCDLRHKDITIILNKSPDEDTDFKNTSKYTIDIYRKYFLENTNLLDDFSSFSEKKLSKYMTKMYYFVEKEQKITNFRWKFHKKS